jgi:hypothetical protein
MHIKVNPVTQLAPKLKPIFVSVGMILYCLGCTERTPTREYLMEKIGGFYVTSASNHLDENFYVRRGLDSSTFGLSIQGSEAQLRSDSAVLISNAMRLKLTLQLFDQDGSNEFYSAQIHVASNCVYYPLWKPDFGYLIAGVEPFPYSHPSLKEVVTGKYRIGKDTLPLVGGKPSPGAYRVRVTIDNPVSITNRFQLWLYSYRDGSEPK